MDETHNEKDEKKTEYGLRDSDFASSTPKATDETKTDVVIEKKEMPAVEKKAEIVSGGEKPVAPKKGFLTLPITDILREFVNECLSLAKDSEWISKSLAGFFGVNALLSFATYFMRSKVAVDAAGAPNISGTQAVTMLIIFLLMLIATAGMINVVIKKVLFKENVEMFAYDASVVKLLKKVVLYIVVVLGTAVICALVLSVVLTPLMGAALGVMVSSLLTVVIALYISIRLSLLLPATVAGNDVGLGEVFGWSGGYASSIMAIVLIYGILYSLFLSLITAVASLAHNEWLVIFINVVFSLINQVLAMTLFAKIYQYFKKHNMLG